MMKILGILKRLSKIQKIIAVCIAGAVLIGSVVTVVVLVTPGKKEKKTVDRIDITPEEIEEQELPVPDEEDPQSVVVEEQEAEEQSGASVNIDQVVDENRTEGLTYGIDVSKYQGVIDWKQVANAGIDFAMIRVGHRTLVSGVITEDGQAKYNMQEAQKNGIKIGVYFFSTAINEAEAREEANWVADYIAKYQITYPVAYDCEGFNRSGNRQYGMSIEKRTDTAVAFLNTIAERGYSTLFYGSKSDMEDEVQWDMDRISSLYSVWVAQYPSVPYPQTQYSSYSGSHVMWQYTSKGSVPGIKGNVDMNVAYFGYANAEAPKNEETPEEVEANVEAGMNFTEVNEQVTAKEKTNLRDKPSQGADSNVMHTLLNGEIATRTGVSASGWSRVIYNGSVYYAVSSYLTTDLNYKLTTQEPDDGINTVFTAVDNKQMTAKEKTNLRAKPSVDDTIAPVVATIENGDVVTMTGINTDVGWARVVYNGQTLYCVSSLLKEVE